MTLLKGAQCKQAKNHKRKIPATYTTPGRLRGCIGCESGRQSKFIGNNIDLESGRYINMRCDFDVDESVPRVGFFLWFLDNISQVEFLFDGEKYQLQGTNLINLHTFYETRYNIPTSPSVTSAKLDFGK